jgi:GntR family transcriptional regulator/MocR family aminotransferase
MADSLLADWLTAKLRCADGSSLQTQIAAGIRGAILDGTLKPSARLPSSRTLASALGVARVTVVHAYDKLLGDGFLEAGSTSGTFVSDKLVPARNRTSPEDVPRPLSRRGAQIVLAPAGIQECRGPFVPGVCDTSSFPYQVWRRIQNRYLGKQHAELTGYVNHGGYLPLRRALAEYLRISRGVRAAPEQVIVTMGTNQSIDLCSRILSDSGELALVENPCHWATPIVLRANGLQVESIDVDGDGIRVGDFAREPKLIAITPSHQFPMGVTLSKERRLQVLNYAQRVGAFVLEDDYDSEFRYDQRALSALQGEDPYGRVILMGTFSKVTYPGMRLSYVVVPPDLVDSFAAASLRLYRPGHLSLQASMADFIADGHFSRHVRNMREIYGSRHAELIRCLDKRFKAGIDMSRNAAGLHLTVRIEGLDDFEAALARAHGQGIYLRRLHAFNQGRMGFRDGFLLGFGAVDIEAISPSVDKLASIVDGLMVR